MGGQAFQGVICSARTNLAYSISSSRSNPARSSNLSSLLPLSVLLLLVSLSSLLVVGSAGQQPSATDGTRGSTTPLHEAAVAKDRVRLKNLLDSGQFDVNALDQNGRTPLAAAMAACSNRSTSSSFSGVTSTTPAEAPFFRCEPGIDDGIAVLLVCAGGDVNVDVFPKDRPGYKLIHHAACYASTSIHELLAGGADPNALYTIPDSNSTTPTTVSPLTWAIRCGHLISNITGLGPGFNEWAIMRMIKGGSNPLLFGADRPASALLHMPEQFKKCDKPGACTAEWVGDRMRELLLSGDAARAGWEAGPYEQIWSAQEGYYFDRNGEWKKKEAGNQMMRSPAAASAANGTTVSSRADICAAANASYQAEVARRELQDLKAWYKVTFPLHVAVANNDLAAVERLLGSGKYDVNGKDNKGFTPLQLGLSCYPYNDFGCSYMKATTAAYLISKGAHACVLNPIYPDFRTQTNYTLLHRAAFEGLRDLVQVLLKGGAIADINLPYYDADHKSWLTPLMSASVGCYTGYDSLGADISINGTIKLLLESGADPLPFGPDHPPTSVMIKIPYPELRECGEKAGACRGNATEVKAKVQQWEREKEKAGEYMHIRTCPDSWLRLWEAQEGAAAAGKTQA